jgi:hypothetical protein
MHLLGPGFPVLSISHSQTKPPHLTTYLAIQSPLGVSQLFTTGITKTKKQYFKACGFKVLFFCPKFALANFENALRGF